MTSKVMKIGDLQGIVFDTAFMDLSALKVEDGMDVTVGESSKRQCKSMVTR